MDINQLVRESYKNTATGYVDDRSREPEPDYSARQVEALEKIAENTLHRVNAAEHALDLHKEQLDIARQKLDLYKEQLDMYKKQIADAEKEAKAAACRSWVSIFISIAAIAGSIIGAAISAGWIQLAL